MPLCVQQWWESLPALLGCWVQTLPGDLALSHALDSSVFEYVWLPREPSDVQDSDIM